jgi:hypothetical protein
MKKETGTPVHSELGPLIRSYDPFADLDGLRACIIEQQEFHRGLESSWPEGQAIIDDYVNYLETQCTLHNGRVIVAECGGELVGFVCVVASTNGESADDPAPFAWIHDSNSLTSNICSRTSFTKGLVGVESIT